MKKIYLFLIGIIVFSSVNAQISITTNNVALTENFSSMGSSAAAALPSGFKIGADWEVGATSATTIAAGTSGTGALAGNSSGGVYNFADGVTATSTDRALGFLFSGTGFPGPRSIIVKITNNTGTQITSIDLSFDFEKYRTGTRAFDWTFFHGATSTAIISASAGNQSYGVDAANAVVNPPTTISKVVNLTGLSINSGSNYYLRWTYTGVGGSSNSQGLGLDNFSIVTNSAPLPACPEPLAQPTSLSLTPTPNSVSGTFTTVTAPTTIQNYLVVRTTTSILTALPVDGTTYALGSAVNGGNGTVVAISDDGNFVNNTVVPSTQYFYFVFSVEDQNCSGAPNYLQTSPLTNSTTTPALPACSTPAAAPTSLILTAANTTINGSFTASASANSYLTIISASNTLSATPVDGTTYANGTSFGGGRVVSYQSSTSFVVTGLTPATMYYLFVFAANNQCTGAPFYLTTSLNGTTTTTNNSTGIPAGYYAPAAGLTGQPLKTALKNIITSGANTLSYTPGLWNLFQFSDLRRNDAGTADIIWDMYSDNPTGPEPYTFTYGTNQCGNYVGEGDCYNREHSTPQSFFSQLAPMVSDAHHIFPTDGRVNAIRSSFPYGAVSAATTTSLNGSKLGTGSNFGFTGTVFEPLNAYKGDFARAGLYMATRYEDQIIAQNWSSQGTANALFLSATDEPNAAKRRLNIYDAWQLSTLIAWHNQDPPSQKEIDRNNAIYYQVVTTGTGTSAAQNNRNPFVDHPEYVAAIFSTALPVTLISFEGQQIDNDVLLKWNAAQENSFKQYEIERSFGGNNYIKVGTVAGQNLINYQFTDYSVNANSIVYYRLKLIDIDGRFKYSNVVAVRFEQSANSIQVFPNPTNGNAQLRFATPLQAATIITVYDFTGRIVKKVNATVGSNITNLNLTGLSAGKYAIKIADNRQVITKSVIIAN